MADVQVDNQGTIVAITPLSDAAREWLNENVQAESWQWVGDTLGVEPRYAGPLLEGMQAAGLTVEK
jgi:hypothetical protein